VSAPRSTFALTLSRSIWHVTLDGLFFGAYPSKAKAIAGIDDSRRALSAAGRLVTLHMPEEDDAPPIRRFSAGRRRQL
jgi:hypothetical protein